MLNTNYSVQMLAFCWKSKWWEISFQLYHSQHRLLTPTLPILHCRRILSMQLQLQRVSAKGESGWNGLISASRPRATCPARQLVPLPTEEGELGWGGRQSICSRITAFPQGLPSKVLKGLSSLCFIRGQIPSGRGTNECTWVRLQISLDKGLAPACLHTGAHKGGG